MFQFLLLVSFATFVATFASSDESKYLANTDLLRQFYSNIIKEVKEEGTRMLDNELTKIYTNVDDNNTQTFMRDDISRLWRIGDFQNDPLCTIVDRFKHARGILRGYSQLMAGQNSVMDAIYKRVENQCPSTKIPTINDDKANAIRSEDVTLLLTYSSGLGEFMRRSLAPNRFCCMFSEKAEGGSNLINFYFGPFHDTGKVQCGRHVALGAKGHYLTIKKYEELKWDKVADSFGQKWIISNPCKPNDSYSEVKYCDLVAFQSEDNRNYLGRLNTAPNITDGTFVVLGPDGKIPQ